MFFKKKQELNPQMVRDVLAQVIAPGSGKDLISLGFVKRIQVSGPKVRIDFEVTDPSYPAPEQLTELCRESVQKLPGVEFVHISKPKPNPTAKAEPAQTAGKLQLPGVRKVIAIASGKGGVGKSTVAINLAVALAAGGKRVGLLDADIYGPSLPTMMGISGRPENAGGKLVPLERHGVRLMSIGFVVPQDQPVVWRGPMVHGALTQFMTQVDWGDLDYLLIDMPPGTGDAQLTISQNAPLSGAIVVTTPQEISLLDARKGLKMFESVHVPILGIVENMAGFLAPDGSRHEIFRSGGGSRLAEEARVPLLGSLPLDPRVAEGGDLGEPVVQSSPDSPVAKLFSEIAKNIAGASRTDSDFQPLSLNW
ncbi:MAG: Mrp/NBP35 family ATP-binding protein [Bdellovibrionales bacterium]|nr:Mrp/NBP35 family ATP-binding protein [Bdellovibrionales bacterium]